MVTDSQGFDPTKETETSERTGILLAKKGQIATVLGENMSKEKSSGQCSGHRSCFSPTPTTAQEP